MNIVLSNLQHAYTIYVPTLPYMKELEWRKTHPDAPHRLPASHDSVAIKPGFNNFDDAMLERLKSTKPFLGLLDSGKVFINDRNEENRYNTEVRHILNNNKEYQEHKKKADLQRNNVEQQKVISDLKESISDMQKQMEDLKKMLPKKVANNVGNEGANDHPVKHKS